MRPVLGVSALARSSAAGALLAAALRGVAVSAPCCFPAIRWRSPDSRWSPPFTDRISARHRPARPRRRSPSSLHGARTSLAVALAAAAAALVCRRPGRHCGGLRRRACRRGADAHHRGVPDRAGLSAGAGLRQRRGPSLGRHRPRPSRSAPGRRRRGLPAPRCCRCANATTSPLPASSACTRSRSRCARSCPTPLPPVLALASVIVAQAHAGRGGAVLPRPRRSQPSSPGAAMIAEGRTVLRTAPFLSIIPGLGAGGHRACRLPDRRSGGGSRRGAPQPGMSTLVSPGRACRALSRRRGRRR